MKLLEQIFFLMFSKNDVPLAYNWRFKLGLDLHLRNIEKLFKPNLTVEQESNDKIHDFFTALS